MDLTSLTKPAVLGQCLRCSSSLAVLENEWAKLSNSYSFVTAWLSLDLHRISISSERKQIPDTSDMNLLRGRIIQEASCKLCQQKLGVICTMDKGPNFLWKLSRVSFREVVTMRTADPIFKEGALERYFLPQQSPTQHPGKYDTLATSGTDLFTQQQMHHQGRSIDQISHSVHHLQDTMADLKNSFTSLRIELNGSHIGMGENGIAGFDMIATVLKELKSKSEEIEKLTLEIEALKLKNRFMEDRRKLTPEGQHSQALALPEVRSPGLLQAGRKRAWPDAFPPRGLTIADSFAEDDIDDDLALEESVNFGAQVSNTSQMITKYIPLERAPSPQYRIEHNATNTIAGASNAHPNESQSKRQRLAKDVDEEYQPGRVTSNSRPQKRKSMTQAKRTYVTKDSRPVTPSSNEPGDSNTTTRVPLNSTPSSDKPAKRGRGRPTTRSRSVGPVKDRAKVTEGQIMNKARGNSEIPELNSEDAIKTNGGNLSVGPSLSSDAPGPNNTNGTYVADSVNGVENSKEEKRKAKVIARDHLTKLAMQREEAMDTGSS